MLLYKCTMDMNKMIIAKKPNEKDPLSNITFTHKHKKNFNMDNNYIPTSNTSTKLVETKNINVITVGINFVASARAVKIKKGFSTLEVFGGSFYISENYVRIVGNFDTKKYSKQVPMLSLIVESLREGEENILKNVLFYYDVKDGAGYIRIVENIYDNELVPLEGKLVNLTFYKQGVKAVYIIPSQRIISDYKTKEAVVQAIGRKPNPAILKSIYLNPTIDDAKSLIKEKQLDEPQVILVTNSYTRSDLF